MHRLMWDGDELADIFRKSGEEKMFRWRMAVKYDPSQPRVPSGDSRGGQWTSDSSSVLDGVVDVERGGPAERAVAGARTGEPLETDLFRGTGTAPAEARRNRTPSQYAVGEYWSPFPEVASTYGPDVRKEKVRLENPYVFDLPGKRAYFQELVAEFGTRKPEEITAKLRSAGHDGLIVRNVPVNRRTPDGDVVAMGDSMEVILFR